MIPGEYFIKDGEIELNKGRKGLTLTVSNTGDRPIQVGSHYHFFETNPALQFDRKKARGMRLDIPAGTAVRFEPGQTRDVKLVALAGTRTVYGFRQDVMGRVGKRKVAKIMTSGLAQARPSRSQRCYRGWDQDQSAAWCDAGSGFGTRPTRPWRPLSSGEPNASDLKMMILAEAARSKQKRAWTRWCNAVGITLGIC